MSLPKEVCLAFLKRYLVMGFPQHPQYEQSLIKSKIMQEKKGEKKVFPVYLKWIVIIMCVYDSNSVFVLSNKDIKLIPSSFAVTLKKGFIWCAGVQKQNKKLWWFLIRLLGLLSQGIWLDMKECSAFLWAWLLEGGRGKDPVFFLCTFQLYYPVGLVRITHLSSVICRLVSILKEQEDEGLHQQEINQCRGKGCCLFLNGLAKCSEALLFSLLHNSGLFPLCKFLK